MKKLSSIEIHHHLLSSGFPITNANKKAFEHHLGNGTFVYVNNPESTAQRESTTFLVISPAAPKIRAILDAIPGVEIDWNGDLQKPYGVKKSTAYSKFERHENTPSGYGVWIETRDGLNALIKTLKRHGEKLERGAVIGPRDMQQVVEWALQDKLRTGVERDFDQPRPDLAEGWVYGFAIPAYPNFIKIGYTGDLVKRMSSLQVAIPEKISVEFKKQVRRPRAVEQLTHWLLSEKNIRGEWFEVDVATVSDMVDHTEKLLPVG